MVISRIIAPAFYFAICAFGARSARGIPPSNPIRPPSPGFGRGGIGPHPPERGCRGAPTAAAMVAASGPDRGEDSPSAPPPPPPPPPTHPPIETSRVHLSSGTVAEVMTCVPPPASSSDGGGGDRRLPPLAFVHGSFHGAWCWAERYLPHFAALGYPVAALSLRGTGGTPAGEGVSKVKIDEHVGDVRAFLEYIGGEDGLGLSGTRGKPVLISHSFGGLSAMKLLERDPPGGADYLSGVALLCSVPPSGIGKMSMRSLRRNPWKAFKTIRGLAMKKCATDPSLCREMFFDADVPEKDLLRYQANFRRDSVATIDLGDLSKQLPSACADDDGKAAFASKLPATLVLGGSDDFIVDKDGVEQTALFFGVEPTIIDSPHDVMLCSKWREGADAIKRWLEEEVQA